MLLDLLPLQQPQVAPTPPLSGPVWTPVPQRIIQRQRGSLHVRLTITGRAKTTARASLAAHVTRTTTPAPLRTRGTGDLRATRDGRAQMRARARLDLDLTARATPAPLRLRSAHLTSTRAALRTTGIRHNPLPWPIHELLFESWDQ